MNRTEQGTKISICELKAGAKSLNAGDILLLNGEVYTARDAAHKRMFSGGAFAPPFVATGAVIYYAGPTPARPGEIIGACGPTTSSRMDGYAADMYDGGMAATIGKGPRCGEVTAAIARNAALYLCAIGGAGALYARHVTRCETVAYEDLGCEAVRRLTLCDFPVVVGIDARGKSAVI